VYQLEGLSFLGARQRLRQIRRKTAGQALLVTGAFSVAETALTFSLVSLLFWLAPPGLRPDPIAFLTGEPTGAMSLALAGAYAGAVLFLEPFYVGAGFAMYVNRRAELEAWDLEQEFRRAFAA
jgi:hypothetical protein